MKFGEFAKVHRTSGENGNKQCRAASQSITSYQFLTPTGSANNRILISSKVSLRVRKLASKIAVDLQDNWFNNTHIFPG